MTSHLVIPDTQAKVGAPTKHLEWIGRYILDRRPDVVVHLGDHWDMPSLSSYDKGRKAMEGRRYLADVAAGNEAWAVLNAPLEAYNAKRREFKEAQYLPRRVLLRGNHEHRIMRAVEADAQLDGVIGYHHLESPGWEVHDFLAPVEIDGVSYVHFLVNPMNGRPMGGPALTRLRNYGASFTMGHQQTLDYGLRFVKGRSQHALVAGSCYLHEEDYLPVDHQYWRGVIVKHQVEGGSYDPMFVSLDYLCRKYEGVSLAEWKAGNL